MVEHGLRLWRSTIPDEAARWLRDCRCRWWLAGGWALDRFLGGQTRPHGDLDLGCLRREATELMRALRDWEFHGAAGERLTLLQRGEAPASEVNSLWCRPARESHWHLELLLDEADGEDWVFRRDRRVRLPLAELTWEDPAGMRVLRPEVQLLYKAKYVQPRDEQDFARVHERMEPAARAWLRRALERGDASHPWLRLL